MENNQLKIFVGFSEKGKIKWAQTLPIIKSEHKYLTASSLTPAQSPAAPQ